MALTNAFKETVSSKNVRRVRIMMKDSMLNDPTFSEFNAMKNKVQDLAGLYDPHDGRNLNYDKTTWTDSYMDELMVQIVGNFSHERIEHLQYVVQYLRPTAVDSRVSKRESTNDQANTQRIDHQNWRYLKQEISNDRVIKIIGGAIIGGAAGGTIAAAATASIVGGVAIGAVSGFIAITVITNGE